MPLLSSTHSDSFAITTYLDCPTFQMVHIPGGRFFMGSESDEAIDWEHPVHEVTVDSFALGRFPVTQEVWQLVMADTDLANPSHFSGEHHPVEQVSWEDVQRFLERLNQIPEIVRRNEADGQCFRLPSEAQWEYAARGGPEQQVFKFAGGNKLKEVGWYSLNNHHRTESVGLKQPNTLGLYDMSGNVDEWCADHWHNNYQGAPQDGSAWTEGGADNSRVVRGGSWDSYDDDCRVSLRDGDFTDVRDSAVGFRLARY